MYEFSFTKTEYIQLVTSLLNRIDFIESMLSRLSYDTETDLYEHYLKELNTCRSLYNRLRCF